LLKRHWQKKFTAPTNTFHAVITTKPGSFPLSCPPHHLQLVPSQLEMNGDFFWSSANMGPQSLIHQTLATRLLKKALVIVSGKAPQPSNLWTQMGALQQLSCLAISPMVS